MSKITKYKLKINSTLYTLLLIILTNFCLYVFIYIILTFSTVSLSFVVTVFCYVSNINWLLLIRVHYFNIGSPTDLNIRTFLS